MVAPSSDYSADEAPDDLELARAAGYERGLADGIQNKSSHYAVMTAAVIDDLRLGHAAFRVMACLLIYADSDGWCWPKQKTVADRLGITRGAVAQAMGQLKELGYLEIEQQFDPSGAQMGNRYKVVTPRKVSYRPPVSLPIAPRKVTLRPPLAELTHNVPNRTYPEDEVSTTAVVEQSPTAKPPKKPNRVGQFVDACTALGIKPVISKREAGSISNCSAAPEEIAAAYAAVVAGKAGSQWVRQHLSVHTIVDNLAGIQLEMTGSKVHGNGKSTPMHGYEQRYWADYKPQARRSDEL